jgi:hypothetical protein
MQCNEIIPNFLSQGNPMQFRNFLLALGVASFILASMPLQATAADKLHKSSAKAGKTYGEEEFLNLFQNRSRKQVSDVLGKPARIGQSSKPAGADATLGKRLDSSKDAHIEMWYYANKVNYAPKHTYKTVELTFVNDRCLNIAYFN